MGILALFKQFADAFNSSKHDDVDRQSPSPAPFISAAGQFIRLPGQSVLFLDFDGVLHVGDYPTFQFGQNLIDVLSQFPTVDVVISSNWKDSCSFNGLLKNFPQEFRHRIVGATPTMNVFPHNRHQEIMACVNSYGIQRFVALDDSSRLFPADCPYLFLTNKTVALCESTTIAFRERCHSTFF